MILLRHAQSEFNALFSKTQVDPGIADPSLTELGRDQARAAARQMRGASARRIITSPYSRALETTAILNEALRLPVTVETIVSERGAWSCDVGTERDVLARRWPDYDFTHLDNLWWRLAETQDQLLERCRSFHARMAAVPDWPEVLVVTHWGFIRGLTGETVQNAETVSFDPRGEPAPDPFAGL